MARTGLRRGFKAEANSWSRDLRAEMELERYAPLCPWKLAEHLHVQIFQAEELCSDEEMRPLLPNGNNIPFSAVTLFDDKRAFIVHSSSVSRKRQAADIAHELAHILLGHVPTEHSWHDGQRHYDPVSEEEANWLGPALLISDEAALHIARLGLSITEASNLYGASKELVQMRLNVTGAKRRVARRAA